MKSLIHRLVQSAQLLGRAKAVLSIEEIGLVRSELASLDRALAEEARSRE